MKIRLKMKYYLLYIKYTDEFTNVANVWLRLSCGFFFFLRLTAWYYSEHQTTATIKFKCAFGKTDIPTVGNLENHIFLFLTPVTSAVFNVAREPGAIVLTWSVRCDVPFSFARPLRYEIYIGQVTSIQDKPSCTKGLSLLSSRKTTTTRSESVWRTLCLSCSPLYHTWLSHSLGNWHKINCKWGACARNDARTASAA